jgi:DNA-binding IclR family transcriptional regulator
MTSKIVGVLEILNDGKWHALEEIQQKAGLSESQSLYITEFLKEYEFVILDEEKKKAKLNREAKKFLTKTATV